MGTTPSGLAAPRARLTTPVSSRAVTLPADDLWDEYPATEPQPDETNPDAPKKYRPGRPNAAQRMAIASRRQQVALLTQMHVPYSQQAEILGCGISTIGDDVVVIKRQWAEAATRKWDEYLAEELAKLDSMERAWAPKAIPLTALTTADDVSAAGEAARVMDRIARHRARLLGLYAPQRTEITGAGGGPIEVTQSMEARVQRALTLVREIEGVEEVERQAIEASSTVREDEAG